MIEKRSLYILKLIINNPDITTQEIGLKINLSRRQVDYSIENINNWLTANNYNEIEKKFGGKLFFKNNVKAIIKDLLIGNVEYIFNEEERQRIIFFYLYLQYEEISLFHIADILKVSRGTITDDLKKLNKNLKPLHISVKYSRESGYQFIGEEIDIFYAMIYYIVEIISYEEALYIIQVIIQNEDLEFFYNFRYRLNQELINNQVFISDNNLNIISYTYVFYTLRGNNITLVNKEKLSFDIEDVSEYTVSKKVLNNIKGVEKNKIEILTSLLLSYSTKKVVKRLNVDLMIDRLIVGVLDRLKKTYAVILKDKEMIFEQLRVHIRPAIFRIYFNLPMVNPLKAEIISKYGHIFTIIEDLFQHSNLQIINSMSEDDIAYLTIHFATFIRDTKNVDNANIKSVIVCPSGIGVSVLLRKELLELFPGVKFLESVSIGQLNQVVDEVDVVFSTVLVETDKPLFLVNPVMNNIEKVNLVKKFNKKFIDLSAKEPVDVKSLIATIEKYADINDEEGLFKELSYLLSEQLNNFKIRKEQPMLSEITSQELIQLNVEAKDWKDAIHKSAQVMVENGKVTDDYVKAMIKNTKENGPYIVITKHVALPHARPEDGVLETAIGITTLKEPIVFGHELHDPVKYVFCLSTVNNNSHLRALAELVELLDDDKFYELLEQTKDAQEILNYIVKKEEIE